MIVAQGSARDALVHKMRAKFDAGDDGQGSYRNRPADMPPRMAAAVGRYGQEFYSGHFELDRGDKAGRRAAYRGNYEFWGAPVHLLL